MQQIEIRWHTAQRFRVRVFQLVPACQSSRGRHEWRIAGHRTRGGAVTDCLCCGEERVWKVAPVSRRRTSRRPLPFPERLVPGPLTPAA